MQVFAKIGFALGIWAVALSAVAQGPQTALPPRPPAPGLYYNGDDGIWLLIAGNPTQGYTGWYRPSLEVNGTASDSLGWYRLTYIPGHTNPVAYRFDTRHLAQSFLFYPHVFGGTSENPCYQVSLHFVNAYTPDTIPLSGSMGSFVVCPQAPVEQFVNLDTANRYIRQVVSRERFQDGRDIEVRPAKPVLYFYPPTPTDVDVRLSLPTGIRPLCYPNPQPDGQWHFAAQPNGRLKCRATGTEYPSLFWETETPIRMPALPANEGWLVSQNELVPFLEARLTEMNFTPQERAEFIQYWLPQLARHNGVFVHFAFVGQGNATGIVANATGTQYDAIAPLTIHPAPDEMLRVMLFYQPLDLNARMNGIVPQPQTLPRFNRTGFHVLEWGGSQAVMGNQAP